MKGVYDSSSKRRKSKLKSRGCLNDRNNSIIKKEKTKNKRDIMTPLNISKIKKNDFKENFYNITEISNNKNKKLSIKRNSLKKNESNCSMVANQIKPKKFDKRNKSFYKEEYKSKNKSKKRNTTTNRYESREKSKNKSSFVKFSDNKKNKLIINNVMKSNDKSLKKVKPRNENLLINFSFNDRSFNKNITSISLNKKSKSKKNDRNKSKNNNNDYNNNIKKVNLYSELNISNTLKTKRKSKNVIRGDNTYENFNSYKIGTKPKLFSFNNNYYFFYNYSLYIIDNENNIKASKYSNENEYIKAINSNKEDNKIIQNLLILEKRDWYDDLISISKLIIKKRDTLNKNFNQIIERYISLYEQYNWIIYSLSVFFKNIIGENQDFDKNFINNKKIHGLSNKFEDWINGFKWKNLYIRAIPIEKGKILINEIKALNYYFFEYLQLLINTNSSIKKNNYLKKVQLLYNIIFPLIGYSKIYSYILYVSVIIKLENKIYYNNSERNVHVSHITTEELIEQSNKLLNYYTFSSDNSITTSTSYETNISINENNNFNNNYSDNFNQNKILFRNNLYKYNKFDLENSLDDEFYIKDLEKSKLFKEINNSNLIKIKEGKYILFNLSRYIPNLFEIKFKNAKKMNFYSEINNEIKYFTLYQNHFLNKSMHNIPHKYIKTPEDVLDLIYNMKPFSSRLNYKEVLINNVYFKIIYEKTEKTKKDYKTLTFIDHLFTYDNLNSSSEYYEKNNRNSNISNILNGEKNYIKGKYVILYDLIEPIKLNYSLIKNHQPKYENEQIYDVYFLKTNYFSLFISWCDMLNKNNFNIKKYSDLKYFMKKYNINTKLLFFSLAYIINEDISDIIKIHLLIKLIYQIFKRERQNIEKIFFKNIILYILYHHELSFGNETKKSKIFYSNLGFYISVLYLNYKLIDEYIGLGLLNTKNENSKINNNINNKQSKEKISILQSPKDFLKHIIFIARKKPFLFLSEFEMKFNIIINPYIKFKSSISLESMEGYLLEKYFSFNKNIVFSYIKPDEISGLIFIILSNNQKEHFRKNSIDSDSNENNTEPNNIKAIHNYKSIKNINKNNKGYYKSKRMSNTKEDKESLYSTDENLDEFSHEYYQKEKISKMQLVIVNSSFRRRILLSPAKDIINIGKYNIYWKDICNTISIFLSPICYKLNYNYEKKSNKTGFLNFLKYEYNMNNSEILKLWNESNISIFEKIKSCSGNTEYSLYKTYIYLFIYYYFIEKDKEKQKNIISKMKSFFLNGFYRFSFNELAILFLFEGLSFEKNGQESLAKCLALFLLTYGEPRGRFNDSHGIIQFPLWIISKEILDLAETIIYEYFKEMYQTLDYFETKKNNKLNENNNKKDKIYLDYLNNIQNNVKFLVFLSITNDYQKNIKANISCDKISNHKSEENYISNNHISSAKKLNFQGDSDIFINKEIFNDATYIDKIKNNSYFFPSINNQITDIFKAFYNKDFIIYIFKQIQNNFLSRNQLFDNNYINKIISFGNLEQNESLKYEKHLPKDSSSFKSKLKNEYIQNPFIYFLNTELLNKLSYKKNIQSGIIISFGNNAHNETSHEYYEMIALPRVIFKLKNVIIEKIYSGWEHNAVISKKNEIYTFGNNQSFQCGLPNINKFTKESIPDPTNISELYNIYANSISCGNEHTLILANNKNVYGIGSNEDGVLGNHDIKLKSYKPLLIHFGDKDEYTKKIIQISSGTVHNLALTSDGKIFSWGAAMGGQLGHDESFLKKNSNDKKNYYISKPSLITSLINKQIYIDKISCGEAHSVALTENGNVYSWGFGSNGQLGLGFCEDSFELGKGLAMSRRLLPEKIKIEKIKDIQCGKTFTMFINEKNKLLACGNNDINQLGFQFDKKNKNYRCNDLSIPTLIDFLTTFKVKKIACGEGHCLAIINDTITGIQCLWSWGNNKYGQTGQGSINKVGLPKPINLLSDFFSNDYSNNDKSEIEEISCGGFHSLCLIKYKKSINWIYDDYDKKICKSIDECDILNI